MARLMLACAPAALFALFTIVVVTVVRAHRQRRRLFYARLLLAAHLAFSNKPRKTREARVFPRSNANWTNMIVHWPQLSQEQRDRRYYEAFRMDEASFNQLLALVRGAPPARAAGCALSSGC